MANKWVVSLSSSSRNLKESSLDWELNCKWENLLRTNKLSDISRTAEIIKFFTRWNRKTAFFYLCGRSTELRLQHLTGLTSRSKFNWQSVTTLILSNVCVSEGMASGNPYLQPYLFSTLNIIFAFQLLSYYTILC